MRRSSFSLLLAATTASAFCNAFLSAAPEAAAAARPCVFSAKRSHARLAPAQAPPCRVRMNLSDIFPGDGSYPVLVEALIKPKEKKGKRRKISKFRSDNSETGIKPFVAHFGSADATYHRIPGELPDAARTVEFLRLLDDNLRAILAVSKDYRGSVIILVPVIVASDPTKKNF